MNPLPFLYSSGIREQRLLEILATVAQGQRVKKAPQGVLDGASLNADTVRACRAPWVGRAELEYLPFSFAVRGTPSGNWSDEGNSKWAALALRTARHRDL